MTDKNMELWNSVEKTDPSKTKEFTGKGGFSGRAIKPMYLIRRATEKWGPMGGAWGIDILSEKIVQGAPMIDKDGKILGFESIHQVLITLRYPGGMLPAFGQTQFVGRRNNGAFFTDEEAPKKSLTDALTKGLSWLGFSADVHEGLYDDVKYLNRVMDEFETAKVTAEQDILRRKGMAILTLAASKGIEEYRAAWAALSASMKVACKNDHEALKAKAGFKEVANAAS